MEYLSLPIKRRELHQQCTVAKDAAYQHVFEHSILDGINGNVGLNFAREKIEVIWKGTEERNEKQIEEKCIKILEGCSKYRQLKEHVESKECWKGDGIRDFRKICSDIEDEYNEKLASFEDHERLPVWQKFAKEILKTEAEMLEFEQSWKLNEARFKYECLQMEQQSEREFAARREQILLEEISHIAKNINMREREKMCERAKKANEENAKMCWLM
ncbi:uncharacterized protein LOC128205510 isoform X1 [Mya arenaria]|uniref:uncharacterized protein LOC128205510 isoform X1 n=1 Tax=Mya arenaria TaxID=6604 RepID=UPI0022E09221|nr:uncharacterized protein LOC128205510 isoform X1 [Mya arenaria]